MICPNCGKEMKETRFTQNYWDQNYYYKCTCGVKCKDTWSKGWSQVGDEDELDYDYESCKWNIPKELLPTENS